MKLLTGACASVLAIGVLVAPTAASSDEYVAAYASFESGEVGTGTGASKAQALKRAKSTCKKVEGRSCKYYYWTKASSHMAIIRCRFPIGAKAEGEFGVKGAHDKTSLQAATKKAYKAFDNAIKRGGWRATEKNCKVIATYSNGAFKK